MTYDIHKLQILNDLIAQTLEAVERRSLMGGVPQAPYYPQFGGAVSGVPVPFVNPLAGTMPVHPYAAVTQGLHGQGAWPIWTGGFPAQFPIQAFGNGQRSSLGW